MTLSVDFTFSGRIACDSFMAFAEHRAGRLSLDMAFGRCNSEAVCVRVEGAEALVDMFEMACSLGPYDCIILDVARRDAPGPYNP